MPAGGNPAGGLYPDPEALFEPDNPRRIQKEKGRRCFDEIAEYLKRSLLVFPHCPNLYCPLPLLFNPQNHEKYSRSIASITSRKSCSSFNSNISRFTDSRATRNTRSWTVYCRSWVVRLCGLPQSKIWTPEHEVFRSVTKDVMSQMVIPWFIWINIS